MSHEKLEPLRDEIFRKLLIASPIFILFIYFMSILFGEESFASIFPVIGICYAAGLFFFFLSVSNRLMESDILRIKTDQKLILSAIYPTLSVIFMCLIVVFVNQETLLVTSLVLGVVVYGALTAIRDNSEVFSIIATILLNIAWYIIINLLLTMSFRF